LVFVWTKATICESTEIRFSTCAEVAFKDSLETEELAEEFVMDRGSVVSQWSGERRP
jgi:hypothetical protein